MMNRRGFVGATLAGVGGFLFPRKSEGSTKTGLSHLQMAELILNSVLIHLLKPFKEPYTIFIKFSKQHVTPHMEGFDIVVPPYSYPYKLANDEFEMRYFPRQIIRLEESDLRCIQVFGQGGTKNYYKEHDKWNCY